MNLKCEFCNTTFVNQKTVETHFCEQKKKSLLLKTKIGQAAFLDYKFWRKNKGFSIPTDLSFLMSRYFKSFINFGEFCKEKLIPEKEGYMTLMLDKDVEPSQWTRFEYHDYYKEMFDTIYPPIKQYQMSLDYLYRLARVAECDIVEVIKLLPPIELMKLIANRKLSPWLLIFMKSFQDMVRYEFNKEHKLLINTIINPEIWRKKLNLHEDSVKFIKDSMNAINI